MPYKKLHFPDYSFEIKGEGQKKLIFDVVRKKFIPFTPEEWVRQHAIHHLIFSKKCNPAQIAVERELRYHTLKKRFDILIFNGAINPVCIVECKAPEVMITSETVLQAAVYNRTFHCPWLWLTNGIQHVWLQNIDGIIQPGMEPASF